MLLVLEVTMSIGYIFKRRLQNQVLNMNKNTWLQIKDTGVVKKQGKRPGILLQQINLDKMGLTVPLKD